MLAGRRAGEERALVERAAEQAQRALALRGAVKWDAHAGQQVGHLLAQQLLSDLQAFQADRKSAKVPSDLAGADADLGDALSAAIAGDQEFIIGMDNGDVSKMKEGGARIDAAMLNIAKAQVALANHLK